MVKVLFVTLGEKLDTDFRMKIRSKNGDKHGDRSKVVRELVQKYVDEE